MTRHAIARSRVTRSTLGTGSSRKGAADARSGRMGALARQAVSGVPAQRLASRRL